MKQLVFVYCFLFCVVSYSQSFVETDGSVRVRINIPEMVTPDQVNTRIIDPPAKPKPENEIKEAPEKEAPKEEAPARLLVAGFNKETATECMKDFLDYMSRAAEDQKVEDFVDCFTPGLQEEARKTIENAILNGGVKMNIRNCVLSGFSEDRLQFCSIFDWSESFDDSISIFYVRMTAEKSEGLWKLSKVNVVNHRLETKNW